MSGYTTLMRMDYHTTFFGCDECGTVLCDIELHNKFCPSQLTIDDDMWVTDPTTGEGAAKCNPSCDLELVRPGKWQCSCPLEYNG